MHDELWQGCLSYIKKEISPQSYKTWFSPIKPINFIDGALTIQVPSQFFYEWLEDNYVDLLKRAITATIGATARLNYSVVVDKGDQSNQALSLSFDGIKKNGKIAQNNAHNIAQVSSPFVVPNVESAAQESNLNPHYIFESFIEGDCNRLARSAGIAVSNRPGVTSFNPLMVYGGVGLGKTHLVQAIGNQIKSDFPEKFILYVASEKFTNQFIDALKNNNVQQFTNYYLNVDILILDDVQFLKDKEKTQEIFFHIFNHLHQNGKQIIMTSDRPPRDLKGLQERLVSRFKWGLTTDLLQPDFETRMAIIRKKFNMDGLEVPEAVIEYLAYTIDTNIRELEGVIVSLIAHSTLDRKDIDLELAKQTLKSIVKDIETEVGIDYIQKTVSEYFSVRLDDLKAKTRKKEIVTARQVAMYFSKEHTNHSLKSIGYHFGGRDHTTVIHAVQTVNDLIDTDSTIRYAVKELGKKFKMSSI